MSKVRIKRKRKPWLYNATKRNFSFGRLCASVLGMLATYGGNKHKEAYDIARTQRTVADVRLKEVTEAYRIEQAKRQELLNLKTRLELEAAYGAGKVARGLGEQVPPGSEFEPANYESTEDKQ